MSVGAFTVGTVREVYNMVGNTGHILVFKIIGGFAVENFSNPIFTPMFNVLYTDKTLKFRRTK